MVRPKRTRPQARTRRLKREPAPAASTPWPTIEAFLDAEEGDISLGCFGQTSIGYAAVASDDHNMLVALVRRPGETLHQLLDRLDQALGPAVGDQILVDEINAPMPFRKSIR